MKTLYTNYTALPAQIPRQLAVQILHSHGEVITLNPLVLDHRPIKPPRDAPNDEYYSTWYEIDQRISFIPGIGKLGTGKITFKGCFHDMPWGLQTHTYIPMGIELRHKWQVRGNQPGEPVEPREIGSQAPPTGLYLQENVEIQCNPLSISFVKKELKAASKVMVERMMKKAELLDAGILQGMFEDGKLKTINPMDKTNNTISPQDPRLSGQWRPDSIGRAPSPASTYQSPASYRSQSSYYQPIEQSQSNPAPIEMMGDTQFSPNSVRTHHSSQSVVMELPGDTPLPGQNSQWSHSSKDSHSQPNGSSRHGSSYMSSSGTEPTEAIPKQAHLSPHSAAFGPPPAVTTPPAGPYQPYNPSDYVRYHAPKY